MGLDARGGLATLTLALLIGSGWPLSGAWAIGVSVGVRLLFAGWSMIVLGSVAGAVADEMNVAATDSL